MSDGHVDTPYGPMPGCPKCDMIALTGPHICEHGVTAPPAWIPSPLRLIDGEVTLWMPLDESTYQSLVGLAERGPCSTCGGSGWIGEDADIECPACDSDGIEPNDGSAAPSAK